MKPTSIGRGILSRVLRHGHHAGAGIFTEPIHWADISTISEKLCALEMPGAQPINPEWSGTSSESEFIKG